MKRKNPYQMLMEEVQDYLRKIKYRKRKEMWFFPKDKLADSWSMQDTYERVAAADQLGYDVILKATKKGLEVEYVKKIPTVPYRFNS